MMIEIGSNRIKDISNLWLALVKELAPDYTPNRDWWCDMAENLIKTDVYHILAYESGSKLIGFIDFFIYPEPSTGKIHGVGQHFYVLPEYRYTGISGKLYRSAIKYGKDHGAEMMEFCCFYADINKWQRKGYIPLRAIMRRSICMIQSQRLQ
jgi:GNAT superfamily N-acetyltransferase